MAVKLFDSELKVMDALWTRGEMSAKQLAEVLKKQVGWSKTTSYTVIKKCIDKKAIERIEPGFLCHPLITREQAQAFETDELVEKFYGGSPDMLVASLVNRKKLSAGEIARLRSLIETLDEG